MPMTAGFGSAIFMLATQYKELIFSLIACWLSSSVYKLVMVTVRPPVSATAPPVR